MSTRKVAVAPGFGGAIWLDRSQKWSRRRRASAFPPAKRPAATVTAFTAPALAPLRASNVRSSSSSRRSRTPQANAPREPPPWRASERRRPRTRDTKAMFAVTYGDGRSAYIRVDPETARHGNLVVMDIARERQEAGEIPDGTIVSVKQVR